jgi:hypothetical protein
MQAKLQSCNNTIYWLPNDQDLNFDMERAEGEVNMKYSVHIGMKAVHKSWYCSLLFLLNWTRKPYNEALLF